MFYEQSHNSNRVSMILYIYIVLGKYIRSLGGVDIDQNLVKNEMSANRF